MGSDCKIHVRQYQVYQEALVNPEYRDINCIDVFITVPCDQRNSLPCTYIHTCPTVVLHFYMSELKRVGSLFQLVAQIVYYYCSL